LAAEPSYASAGFFLNAGIKREVKMTEGKVMLAGLAAALLLGASGGMSPAAACPAENLTLAADDTQAGAKTDETDSAKMGKEEGTHTGANQGAKPENDTDKVEQPERRNPTTGN
jgi:hypothetical protein